MVAGGGRVLVGEALGADEEGGLGLDGAAVAAACRHHLGAGGGKVHHNATSVAAPHAAGIVREVGGASRGQSIVVTSTFVIICKPDGSRRLVLQASHSGRLRALQPVLHLGGVPLKVASGFLARPRAMPAGGGRRRRRRREEEEGEGGRGGIGSGRVVKAKVWYQLQVFHSVNWDGGISTDRKP